MQVNIGEVVSRIQAVDAESLASPAVMQKLVAAVLSALEEKKLRDKAANQDTRLDAGVHDGAAG